MQEGPINNNDVFTQQFCYKGTKLKTAKQDLFYVERKLMFNAPAKKFVAKSVHAAAHSGGKFLRTFAQEVLITNLRFLT